MIVFKGKYDHKSKNLMQLCPYPATYHFHHNVLGLLGKISTTPQRQQQQTTAHKHKKTHSLFILKIGGLD